MSGGPEGGPMGPMGPNTMGPVLNGDGLDGMKNSPANGGPGTPREDSGSGMGDYNLGGFGAPGENVSMHTGSLTSSLTGDSMCCCEFVCRCFCPINHSSCTSTLLKIERLNLKKEINLNYYFFTLFLLYIRCMAYRFMVQLLSPF